MIFVVRAIVLLYHHIIFRISLCNYHSSLTPPEHPQPAALEEDPFPDVGEEVH
jgi:hypothetical protein